MEYRIRKQVNRKGEERFYIEEKQKFLFWSWWDSLKTYRFMIAYFGTDFPIRYFKTQKECQDIINQWLDEESWKDM